MVTLLLVAGVFWLPLSLSAQAPVAPEKNELPERVGPIKLHDVPLDQVLELLERWTGKSLLRPQSLPALTLNLNLKDDVPRTQGIRALETLLSLNGIGISALDDTFLKIVPLNATKAEAPEMIQGSTLDLPPSGRMVSKLFRPKYLRVSEFMPQVSGLLNPAAGGAPAIFEKANVALITDSITNLQRIESLLNEIDRPEMSHLQPKFYALQYVKASDGVAKLHAMFSGNLGGDLGSANFSADDRTNQIVLFADARQYSVFDQLIAKLDVKSGEDTRTDVIYLNHAAAKDVAGILTQLVSGQSAASRASTEQAPITNTSAPLPIMGTPGDKAIAAPGARPDPGMLIDAGLKVPPASQFSTLLNILSEERSNAIVVSGTSNDIRLINDLVSKIDVLLAQVRIEVVIAEVTLDDNDTSGISALGLQISGDKLVGFSGGVPGLGVSNGTVTYANRNANPPLNVSGPWDLAAQITLSTTPRKTTTHILSVPNIITTHNRTGKIFVGQEVPVISSYLNDSTSTGGVGTGYRSTINSKDIGIQLSVKPLIGADQSVQMEISQEVNDILGETVIDGNNQPTIGRRTTESFVSARSGEIIVLGGLQRSSKSRSTSRLGPIPFIGTLLGSRTRDTTRTDLVFFLRPTILSDVGTTKVSALPELGQFPKNQQDEMKDMLQGTKLPEKK